MRVILFVYFTLIFPSIALASKPEDPGTRIIATIGMTLLVALIALVIRKIRPKLDDKNESSNHRSHMSNQAVLKSMDSSSNQNSTFHESPKSADSFVTNKSNHLQNKAYRLTLSLEEALLGHWVSYMDFKNSFEKITRLKHYIATHWYFDKDKIEIIQMEIKGDKSLSRTTRSMFYNVLEKNVNGNGIRIEMFNDSQKSNYSQAILKFSQDRDNMLHETILPRISGQPNNWIYVEP